MTRPDSFSGMIVLALAACTFKPRSSDIEFDVSKIGYERPAPDRTTFTYQVKRNHELQTLCTYLVQAQRNARLALRGPGYLQATPEHCFITSPVTLLPGETRRFSYTFPGEPGLFTDPRAKMKVILRITLLLEGESVARETEWPFS